MSSRVQPSESKLLTQLRKSAMQDSAGTKGSKSDAPPQKTTFLASQKRDEEEKAVRAEK